MYRIDSRITMIFILEESLRKRWEELVKRWRDRARGCACNSIYQLLLNMLSFDVNCWSLIRKRGSREQRPCIETQAGVNGLFRATRWTWNCYKDTTENISFARISHREFRKGNTDVSVTKEERGEGRWEFDFRCVFIWIFRRDTRRVL